MISLKLTVSNLFRDKEYFVNKYWLDRHLFLHKYFDFEYFISNEEIFEFDLNLKWKGSDHAGPSLTLGLGGYTVCFRIYDDRHWDHEANNWVITDQFH